MVGVLVIVGVSVLVSVKVGVTVYCGSIVKSLNYCFDLIGPLLVEYRLLAGYILPLRGQIFG